MIIELLLAPVLPVFLDSFFSTAILPRSSPVAKVSVVQQGFCRKQKKKIVKLASKLGQSQGDN